MYYVCIQIKFDMYLLFMIKARIRWCTCRVENILTLGKLLSLWFVSSSILFVFDISNLLSYIQISSYELARPIMGTVFLVSGLFYTHAKYDKKITRSRRGIWADIPRYAYREILL